MGVVALQVILSALAADAGVMTEVCPLDGTHFERAGHLTTGATSLRLDLRPVGQTPEPLVRCPRCQFVPGPEEPRPEELATLRTLVSSPEYTGHSSHALRARILDVIRPASTEAAFEWMRASWELEDAGNTEWRHAVEHALSAFARVALARPRRPGELEAQRTAKLMQVELLRRLGRFTEADASLRLLRTEKDLQQGIAAKLIVIEGALVGKKDTSPQPFPSLPPLDPLEEDPGFVAAKRLEGFAAFNTSFRIESADLGNFNLLPHSLHLSVKAKKVRPLDSVWWWNFTKDGKPQFDWRQFLSAHAKAEKVVEKNAWLAEWKKASPGGQVELQLAGLESNTETNFDLFVQPAWEDAGFKKAPVVQLILREESGRPCGDVFLDEGGGGIVNIVFDNCSAKNHWLSAKPFSFHPKDMQPTYLRIDSDGRWERRVLGKKP